MTLPPVTCLLWVACSLHVTCQALCSGRADASHSGAASHPELTSPKLALLPLSCLEVPFPARGHVCHLTCSPDSCIVLLLHRHSQPVWWGLACEGHAVPTLGPAASWLPSAVTMVVSQAVLPGLRPPRAGCWTGPRRAVQADCLFPWQCLLEPPVCFHHRAGFLASPVILASSFHLAFYSLSVLGPPAPWVY